MQDLTRLARDARDGDREALARLLGAIQGDVWRFCAHLTRPDEADDLAQETLLRVVGNLHRHHGDSVLGWSLGIARNVCFDHVRRKTRRKTDPVAEIPAAGVDDDTAAVEIWSLLQSLPVEQREALVLTQLVGLPYAEVAEIVGCPIGTIRSRVARGRDALTEVLHAEQRRHGSSKITGT